ncbi:anti-sigma factor [Achromobacter aloeverae]|uniref:Anti-sigma factor n=2 Tax=Achromobacter aloeverae TaxID=1750518 RepID=A0A4Q1HGP6_9BURK|nr:anti-sigma factor [Achromobacter aloeverae]
MEKDAAVSDDDLHAFVDGQLDADRVPAVLRHLQANPDAAVRAASWQAQRAQLRRAYRDTATEPIPATLASVVQRHARRQRWRPWGQAVAALLLVAAGAAGGTLWTTLGARQPGLSASQAAATATLSSGAATAPQFVRDAATAYAVFAPEVRHAVEVPAQEEAHLVQWLSRRLGRPLTAPALQAQGYRLLGGRLLTGDGDDATAPRAQFMYEDARGRRVTLYVAVFPARTQPRETAFRSVRNGDTESFYWIENGYGYALSAALPSSEVQALAGVIYDQLYPR